jgi:hypothetical protein
VILKAWWAIQSSYHIRDVPERNVSSLR